MEGTTFQVEAGEGFIIFPHQIAHYQADVEAPWAYMWVAFSGEGLDELLQPGGISRRFPIIRHRDRSLPLQLLNAMIGFAKENTAAAPPSGCRSGAAATGGVLPNSQRRPAGTNSFPPWFPPY